MYAPEQNIGISGWFETEYGVDFVEIKSAKNLEDLVSQLLHDYGDDIVGVDLELDGEYEDGLVIEEDFVIGTALEEAQ
jgi:hypothetical protein